jgi:hypothetical protein
MADWYVSSAVYATIPVWAATTAYNVGQFVKPTVSAFDTQYVFRCTVAGTSGATEPTWSGAATNNSTIASGGATFANVTGQSTYGWSASSGTLYTVANRRVLVGDRVFASSDHAESSSAAVAYDFNNGTVAFGLVQIVSVSRAGSVPPTASDTQSGASITNTSGSSVALNAWCNLFWQGITITIGGSSAINLFFNVGAGARKSHYLKNCAIVFTTAQAASRISTNNVAKVTLDNTTVKFANVAQAIDGQAPFDFNWINTPSAIQGATIPTTLFKCGTNAPPLSMICRGVDLSAITGTLCSGTTGSNGGSMKALFDSCKIAPGVTRLAAPATITNAGDEVELMNCFDGTNIINERYAYGGSVVIDRSTTLSGGAQDDVGAYSLKLASSTRADFQTMPLDAFWLDVENIAIGVAKTATVEIIGSASLNNTDIRLQLEYTGTSIQSWNPADKNDVTFSNGNLTATGVTSSQGGVRAYPYFSSGKYYWECKVDVISSNNWGVGVAIASCDLDAVGNTPNNAAVIFKSGNIYVNNVYTGTSLGARAANDIFSVAVDATARLIWFRVAPSGNWNASGTADPATGVGGISISALSGALFPVFSSIGADQTTINLGATTFSGSIPSGFVTTALLINYGSFIESLASVLTPAAALPTSLVTWLNPPSTPVKQQLQATFTPRTVGRVRGLVRLGKTSATAWVNPQIAITIPPLSAEASQFLARTSSLDATHTNAYTALIDGLVTDGIWSKLDVLHVYATQNSTTALLNLKSNSYTGTANGSPAFVADRGFTGVDASATVYIDTGFNPATAGGNYSQDSAHISAWSNTTPANSGPSGGVVIGSEISASHTAVYSRYNDGFSYFGVNASATNFTSTGTPSNGHFLANRSSSSALQGYKNGTSVLTWTNTSVAPASQNIYALANHGPSGANLGTAFQLPAISIGSSLSSTDVTNFYNRLRTYMTAVGVP